MKCHYEVLNLERDADDAEIKTAYRKLALRWHPDKNLDDQEGAKEQFQLVQQAYEVLSDSHERAWYDNHREQILRGGQSNYEDKSLDLFQYFTVSCFKGYGDDNQGFYAVYENVFETIATEDSEFIEDDDEYDPPKFGNSTSNYEEVVGPFYAYWQSYCTPKSYAWLCPHNIKDVRDRRIVREIEKENKKIQQKAKKERNEEIRALIGFIRKRDKRVQLNKRLLEEKVAANRLKTEQKRLEQIRSRQKELELQKEANKDSKADAAYQLQLKQLEQAYASDGDEDSFENEDVLNGNESGEQSGEENQEEIILDDLYCVACNKSFRNTSSFKNHESSKKHWDNIKKLKEEMLAEEDFDGEDLESDESDIEVIPEVVKSSKKSKKSKRKAKQMKVEEEELDEQSNDEPVEEDKAEEVADGCVETLEKEPTVINDSPKNESDEDWGSKSNKKKGKPKKAASIVTTSQPLVNDALKDDSDDEWANKSNKKKGKPKKSAKTTEPIKTTIKEVLKEVKVKEVKLNKLKISKEANVEVDTDHTCVSCHLEFESKNKLFAHLKKTGHGVYLDKLAAAAGVPISEISKKGKKKK